MDKDPTLLADLLGLVEPAGSAAPQPDARGDPMSPLRWTCKSLSQLASALAAMGHKLGRSAVGDVLHRQNFSLQAHRKTREGDSHPDRDARFKHFNESVRAALAEGEPVISVDTKKKELVGDFKNAGQAWRPRGEPEEVRVHDFLIQELGRAAPCGAYDLAANTGWVGVDLIAATTTKTGLTVRCELDSTHYTKGIVVSDNEMDCLRITPDAFHGEWNYAIHPAHPTATNAAPVKAVVFG